MRTLNLTQGDPAWHTHRANARNASDAPAVLGCSPYMTRAELLRVRHTGIVAEVPPELERRFAAGHAIEAAQREPAAAIIGEPLYPVVGVEVVDGLELSASFDGITMSEDACYECKTLNDDLRVALVAVGGIDANDGRNLPKHYRVQMEQQLVVSGAERVLFVAADRSGDDVRRCWYYPDLQLRAEILAGWRQFDADLAAYTPPAAEAPKPLGHAPETLPALRIEITGAVTASNLAEFRETALGAIRSVNRELTTDAHFADAEQAVKWCGEVETRIKAAKEHALSQTATIEALFRTLDDVSAEARRVRLDLEKLVERRKVEIKGEMVAAAKAAYERHEAALRQECGAWRLLSPPDFAVAIKGKRNVAAMQDALDTALANAKIKADEQARTIRAALGALDEEAKGFEHLFRDRMDFMMLPPDVVRQMARGRIAEHKAAEERRLEAERARIRAEEEARAREQAAREQRERQEAEDALIASFHSNARRIEADSVPYIQKAITAYESTAKDWENDPRERVRSAYLAGRAYLKDRLEAAEQRRQEVALAEQERRSEEALRQALPAAGPAVIPLPTRAPAAPTAQPTLRLGEIQKRLAPLSIDAAGLATLGFPVVKQEGAAKLWRESDWHGICAAIAQHVVAVANGQKAVA